MVSLILPLLMYHTLTYQPLIGQMQSLFHPPLSFASCVQSWPSLAALQHQPFKEVHSQQRLYLYTYGTYDYLSHRFCVSGYRLSDSQGSGFLKFVRQNVQVQHRIGYDCSSSISNEYQCSHSFCYSLIQQALMIADGWADSLRRQRHFLVSHYPM